jgi:hypothetical protein
MDYVLALRLSVNAQRLRHKGRKKGLYKPMGDNARQELFVACARSAEDQR